MTSSGGWRGGWPEASASSSGARPSRTCRCSTRWAGSAGTTARPWPCCPAWPRPGWSRCRPWSGRATAPTSSGGRSAGRPSGCCGRRPRSWRPSPRTARWCWSWRTCTGPIPRPSTCWPGWPGGVRRPGWWWPAPTGRPTPSPAAPPSATSEPSSVQGLATELRLGELGAEAVAAVLGRGLPGADVPEELARLVHRRTDGVPLFIVQLLQAWTDTGALRPAAGRWQLAGGDGQEVPDDLRRLLELQLERLDADDLAMLETAAVSGVEFAAATAASAGSGPARPARVMGPGPPGWSRRWRGAVRRLPVRAAFCGPPGRWPGRTGPCRPGSGSPTTSTGPCCTTGSRPAGGPACTSPSPTGSNGATDRPRPRTRPSSPVTSWPATTTPGPSPTFRRRPCRPWGGALPGRPSSTWRRCWTPSPTSPRGADGTRPSCWPR